MAPHSVPLSWLRVVTPRAERKFLRPARDKFTVVDCTTLLLTGSRLFDDHLVIWNAGTLPPDLTASDLLKPHKSFPHNKLVAQAFYNTGIIENWGSGTTKMAKELEEAQTRLNVKLNERQLKAIEHLSQNISLTNAEYQLCTKSASQPHSEI